MTVPTPSTRPLGPHGNVPSVAPESDSLVTLPSALGPFQLWRNARAVGYGPHGFQGEAPLALVLHGADARPPGPGFHVALAASSCDAVNRFHAAAVKAGGVDEGPPDIREHYDPGYYAAFVRDLDGHRIEAVRHEPVG